jgi:predicted amidophosphoribosyltransferase
LQAGFSETARAFGNEPAARFLFDTLIEKQRLLARNGCAYLALRTWRKPIKPYQVDALAALKSAPSPAIVERIAEELSNAVTRVYGKAFDTVIPIPPGSSDSSEGLSTLIARQVSKRLNLDCAEVLLPQAVRKGRSHPKKGIELLPYEVKGKVKGNVLILDDVATSGKHMEMASLAIRPLTNYATGIVWLAD